jgi:hypothetical protein
MESIEQISKFETYLSVRSELPAQLPLGVIFDIEQKDSIREIFEPYVCFLSADQKFQKQNKCTTTRDNNNNNMYVEHNFTVLYPGSVYQIAVTTFIRDIDEKNTLRSTHVEKKILKTGFYFFL